MRHSLSYSHSDQALLRDPDLEHCWDGLVVPGTLAAYYFEGTGGFVLTRRVPYLLDPRTPLLQTIEIHRAPPKASHLELAEIHDASVVPTWPHNEIPRSHWEDGRWPDVVANVLRFQETYAGTATGKVDKYNELLALAGIRVAEEQPPEDPLRIVPPYWAVEGVHDPWWSLSREAIEIAVATHPGRLLPIIAIREHVAIAALADLIRDLPDGCDDVFCWASNWDEADATSDDVDGWLAAIAAGDEREIAVRNLYGGALSVLLTALGLRGVNHGVGYSERRDSRRLSATGGPPARYYVPALREFFTVPNAQPVVDYLPANWACRCAACARVAAPDGRPEVGRLTPENLKRHFLLARHAEFTRAAADFDADVEDLIEVGEWVEAHAQSFLPASHGQRLLTWAAALRPAP